MADVLIVADTRAPEMRHEVPLVVPDPFLYAEVDGVRHAATVAMEKGRVEALGIHVLSWDELGADALVDDGLRPHEVAREVFRRACHELGLESALVPERFPTGVADHLRGAGIELIPDAEHFRERRRVKTDVELSGIRRAQRATEAAMSAVRQVLAGAERRNGGLSFQGETLTCELLKRHVDAAFVAHDASAEESIVSHGPQTAVAHDMGSGEIAPDDVVLLDLFPVDRESGCYADMTRVFAVGEPPAELQRYQPLVKEALDLAVAEIRPGVNGKDVHRLVCDFFHEHGFPTQLHKAEGEILEDGFFHGTGHGVGLAVHEAPNLGRIGDELVAGDVITLEPGLYRPGLGGVRLEDLLRVTDDGHEVLTDFPYGLEVG